MALIKTGAGITNIAGTMGGTVFQRDRSGLHMTAPARRVKPGDQARLFTQVIFSRIHDDWSVAAADKEIYGLWVVYAKKHPSVNRLGESILLSPMNWFFRFNLIRRRNGLGVDFIPPDDVRVR